MQTKLLCFKHAKEAIESLFVSQRMIIDTNIPRSKAIQCEYSHDLIPVKCLQLSAVKVSVLANNEPYPPLQDTNLIKREEKTSQSNLNNL